MSKSRRSIGPIQPYLREPAAPISRIFERVGWLFFWKLTTLTVVAVEESDKCAQSIQLLIGSRAETRYGPNRPAADIQRNGRR